MSLSSFLEQELTNRKRDYVDSPTYILEHYNSERENVEEYNGRQLFEMLQNADDASSTAENPKALIKLQDNSLIIANDGQPFSEEGFRSIIYSNFSPKPMQQNKIGQKGLGFRSILSWANEVIINSGNTKVGFSQNYAQSFLKELINDSPHIGRFLAKNSKAKLPIAVLRIPRLLEDGPTPEKYDTIISIEIKSDFLKDVQNQISTVVNKQTLLFLNNLRKIEIDSPEKKIVFTKIVKQDGKVTIESNNLLTGVKESKTWTVNKASGTFNGKEYELSIAWNEKLNDEENVLYSYFKTQVRFPFPALVHGTFELSSNRNQLVNDIGGHNRFLSEKLAELLVDTALKITSLEGEANYLPLKLLNIDFESIDLNLKSFGFQEILTEKIKESSIFPNVNGKYISRKETPAYFVLPIADFLRGEDVRHVVLHCEDEALAAFVKQFANFFYPLNSFIAIIARRLGTLDYAQVALLITHLIKSYEKSIESKEFNLYEQSNFLPDFQGKPISWESSIFFPPQNEGTFELPRTLQISFINPALLEYLLKQFTRETLIKSLRKFNVNEYSFIDIVRTLTAHYDSREETKSRDVKELHSHLLSFFKNEKDKPDRLPSDISVPVLSLKRKVVKTTEVYFGKYYDNKLAEDLYHFDKSKLLSPPKVMGLENENKQIVTKYFEWLGVARLPRLSTGLVRNPSGYREFGEHALRNFEFKKKPIGTVYNNHYQFYTNYDSLMAELNSILSISVGYFDGLVDILNKSKPETILTWIHFDARLKRTLEADSEISDSIIKLSLRRKVDSRCIRNESIRSYVRWLFANTPWLPVASQKGTSEPNNCCLAKTITKDFSPFVEQPNIDVNLLADSLSISRDTVEHYLLIVGVHREISDFSTSQLYEMLKSLPQFDERGLIAKSIYREIIYNFEEKNLDRTHPSYQKFVEEGKILCQKGNEIAYFHIDDAYYVDTKTFGKNVLKRFPLALIDRKRGTQKVNKLFGLKPLEKIKFNLLGEPEGHSLQNFFTEEMERFKAFVYALRINQDTSHRIRNRLKLLKIVLTSKIEAEFVHDEKSELFKLEPFEFVPHKNTTTFYIFVPANVHSLGELKNAIEFKESISEILTNLLGTEEYRSFIREMYSTSEFDRETLLMNELQQDTNEFLLEAKNQLGIIDDIRLSFWRAFLIASKRKLKAVINSESDLMDFLKNGLELESSILQPCFSLETYSDLSELEIQRLFYDLFLANKVIYSDFIRHFSRLNFTPLFRNELEDLKAAFYAEFSRRIFDKLAKDSLSEKKKYFDYIDNYTELGYEQEEGFLDDLKKYFFQRVERSFSVKLHPRSSKFSFDKIIGQNFQQFSESEVLTLNSLKMKRDVQALLLFNEVVELREIIRKHRPVMAQSVQVNPMTNRINFRGKEVSYENYPSLAKTVLEGIDFSKLRIKKSKTHAPDDNRTVKKRSKKRSNSRKVSFDSKNEEEIGFISELLSYYLLCEKYGEANVRWLSENSYRAESTLTGEAGEGYDIRLTENGKVRYVEVKGTSNTSDYLRMSSNEVKKATEFPDKYDLLVVENPLSSNPIFRLWRSPFKFKSGESLVSNKQFRVFNDNYLIRFTWRD